MVRLICGLLSVSCSALFISCFSFPCVARLTYGLFPWQQLPSPCFSSFLSFLSLFRYVTYWWHKTTHFIACVLQRMHTQEEINDLREQLREMEAAEVCSMCLPSLPINNFWWYSAYLYASNQRVYHTFSLLFCHFASTIGTVVCTCCHFSLLTISVIITLSRLIIFQGFQKPLIRVQTFGGFSTYVVIWCF